MKKLHGALVLCVVLGAFGAGQYWPATASVAPPSPKASLVKAVMASRQDVPVILQASGTVTPVSVVDVHAQTTSSIRRVHITEGQFAKAGQLMFSLDDRTEQANVERAQAQIARAQAQLASLERQHRRSAELLAKGFIAANAVDTLRSEMEAAHAQLRLDQAALRAAKVSASLHAIHAPMAGRIGAINVYPGSLVQPSTLLATVTRLDPVAVSFTLPEAGVDDLLAAHQRGAVDVEARTHAGAAPKAGVLSFIDSSITPNAGTIRVKAQFDNRDGQLWPGQYVETRITLRTLAAATVIPQAAIITNAGGTFVYVVRPDDTVALTPVARLHAFGDSAAVSGLAGAEQVVTDGKQNLRPGARVRLAGAAP